jgi:hypothetical protein
MSHGSTPAQGTNSEEWFDSIDPDPIVPRIVGGPSTPHAVLTNCFEGIAKSIAQIDRIGG